MILRQHSVYLQGYNQQELSKFEGAMGEDMYINILYILYHVVQNLVYLLLKKERGIAQ